MNEYSLPGGKQKPRESCIHAAIRELWEETGTRPSIRLRRVRKPIEFEWKGKSLRLSLFYMWDSDMLDFYRVSGDEQNKLDYWRFEELSWLREQTKKNKFPQPVFDAVIVAANRVGIPMVGEETIFEYDFPHGGLHSPAQLRHGRSSEIAR